MGHLHVMNAREALGIVGHCPIGGPSDQGQALLKKARALRDGTCAGPGPTVAAAGEKEDEEV